MVALTAFKATAHDFEQDGIFYKILTSDQVGVAANDSLGNELTGTYSGNLFIPASIVHNGVSYRVTAITDDAFFKCVDLRSVTIPATITELYWDGFAESGTRIIVPDFEIWCGINFHVDYAYTLNEPRFVVWSHELETGCDMENLVFPSMFAEVHNYCFYKTSTIRSVEIPDQVTKIGRGAFAGCVNLKSVKIGPHVTSIGTYAFDVTSNFWYWFEDWCDVSKNIIDEVTCEAVVPPVLDSEYCFTRGTYRHAVLYVPAESIEAYLADVNWGRFDTIRPIPNTEGDVNCDGNVSIADVTCLIDLLLAGNQYPQSADVNGDGNLSIADVTKLIDVLLNGN